MIYTRLQRALFEGMLMGLGFVAIVHAAAWLGGPAQKHDMGRMTITVDCAPGVLKCWRETASDDIDLVITVPRVMSKP